jgi:protease II
MVLDLKKVDFIPKHMLRKTMVSKVKMSDNHELAAFTLDIGNTERLVGGIKDLKTGLVLPNKLENISQIEFGVDRQVFYTECDE